MSNTREFVFSFSVLVGPAIAGYALRRFIAEPQQLARRIQVANVVVLGPIVACLAVWILTLNREIVILPLIGLSISVALLLIARLIARVRGLTLKQAGSYAFSASLSNIGHTMGGFLCYQLISESAFSLSVIYHLYYMWFAYLVCFPYARALGSPDKGNFFASVKAAFTDPRSMPLAGIVLGFALLLWGPPRPPSMSALQSVVIPLSTALAMFGLGLSFFFRSLGRNFRDCVEMCGLKFLVTPALAVAAVFLCGLEPPSSSVVLILSTMPVGIYAFLIATLFDLDVDMANAMFVFTTAVFVAVVLPVLVFVI